MRVLADAFSRFFLFFSVLDALILDFPSLGNLAKYISAAKALQTLNLSNNLIEDEGAIAIAGALWSSPLRTLILTNNEISRVGGAAVAKALQGKSNVSTLVMDNNNIAQSLKEIVTMFQVNTTLTCLSMNSCKFTDQDVEDMARALHNNSTLQVRICATNLCQPALLSLS